MYKAVQVALGEVNYLEKATNSQLDDPVANAGYNNFTKYTRDLDALGDFYNMQKQTQFSSVPWCEIFVDWCFWKAYGKAMAMAMLYQPKKSAGAGCTQSAQYYKAHGAFYSSPKEGDQIYFAWGGEVEHTGLVYKVTADKVYTVEGNTNGKNDTVVPNGGGVFKKEYSRNNSSIYGYGRPDYGLMDDGGSPEPAPEPVPEKPKEQGDTYVTVKLRMLYKGCTGEDVKSMQRLLVGAGFGVGSAGIDGDFGNDTASALKRFQASRKLVQDAICGEKSWGALLGAK